MSNVIDLAEHRKKKAQKGRTELSVRYMQLYAAMKSTCVHSKLDELAEEYKKTLDRVWNERLSEEEKAWVTQELKG